MKEIQQKNTGRNGDSGAPSVRPHAWSRSGDGGRRWHKNAAAPWESAHSQKVEGLPNIKSINIFGFLSAKCMQVVRKFGVIFDPPFSFLGRHIWKPPYRNEGTAMRRSVRDSVVGSGKKEGGRRRFGRRCSVVPEERGAAFPIT